MNIHNFLENTKNRAWILIPQTILAGLIILLKYNTLIEIKYLMYMYVLTFGYFFITISLISWSDSVRSDMRKKEKEQNNLEK